MNHLVISQSLSPPDVIGSWYFSNCAASKFRPEIGIGTNSTPCPPRLASTVLTRPASWWTEPIRESAHLAQHNGGNPPFLPEPTRQVGKFYFYNLPRADPPGERKPQKSAIPTNQVGRFYFYILPRADPPGGQKPQKSPISVNQVGKMSNSELPIHPNPPGEFYGKTQNQNSN